jgi:aromatic-L-amino-acid decarboxylase
VGIVADLLASTLNQNVSLVRGGASAAAVEDLVVRWLRSLLGLRADGGGVLASGGSLANLMGLALAREKAARKDGLVFYVSDEVHSSIERGLRFLGVAPEALRRLPADDAFHLSPALLREAAVRDRAAGLTPAAVIATAGTIGSGAVDPLEDLGEVCRDLGLWLHVDGAYGALAAAAPSGSFLRAGLDVADSLSLDPHKWLFVPIDTSCLLVKDVESLRRFFTVVPEYLKVSAADQEVAQPMESTIELSRRFRALRLWMSLKVYGAGAIRARIEEHLKLARGLASWIEADPRFELSAPVETSTVAFRYVPSRDLSAGELDRLNEALFDRLNREPGLFLSRNRLRGRFTLRACITGLRTREEDVSRLWRVCRVATSELL